MGFNYKMELVHDNNYGALNLTTNKWNGLVRVFPSVFCKSFRSALSTSAKNNSNVHIDKYISGADGKHG